MKVNEGGRRLDTGGTDSVMYESILSYLDESFTLAICFMQVEDGTGS